jgi:GT2 family glycosyltransferase
MSGRRSSLRDLFNQVPVRVLAVVVLYKLDPRESESFSTLQAAISRLTQRQADVKILLYDNTPGGQDPGVLPVDVQYKADPENGGLAKAYNYAIEMAHNEGFDWLLTLDQDTSLPGDFLIALCETVAFVAPLDVVAAIVPCISDGGLIISPFIPTKYWAHMNGFPGGFIGVSSKETYAVNSASAIRVSALKVVGGYDPRYYLYASDLVMFRRLHQNNFRIFVAGNIHVKHEMSGLHLRGRSSAPRYEEALRAEEAFCDEYLGRLGGIVLFLKIFYRMVYVLWRSGGGLSHFWLSFRFLCRRIFYSRKRRLTSWNQSTHHRPSVALGMRLSGR